MAEPSSARMRCPTDMTITWRGMSAAPTRGAQHELEFKSRSVSILLKHGQTRWMRLFPLTTHINCWNARPLVRFKSALWRLLTAAEWKEKPSQMSRDLDPVRHPLMPVFAKSIIGNGCHLSAITMMKESSCRRPVGKAACQTAGHLTFPKSHLRGNCRCVLAITSTIKCRGTRGR